MICYVVDVACLFVCGFDGLGLVVIACFVC